MAFTFTSLLTPEHQQWLGQTINTNTANFGGWKMEGETTPVDETPPVGGSDLEPDPDPTPDPIAGEGDPEGDGPTELDLDGAKAALAKVRQEAASYRTRLRDAETKLAAAKTPEEIEALKVELQTASATEVRDLLVENVALAAGLPKELAEVLKGNTRAELEAHAKVLARFAPAAPSDDPDLEGGLEGGGNEDDLFDAKQAIRKARSS